MSLCLVVGNSPKIRVRLRQDLQYFRRESGDAGELPKLTQRFETAGCNACRRVEVAAFEKVSHGLDRVANVVRFVLYPPHAIVAGSNTSSRVGSPVNARQTLSRPAMDKRVSRG